MPSEWHCKCPLKWAGYLGAEKTELSTKYVGLYFTNTEKKERKSLTIAREEF